MNNPVAWAYIDALDNICKHGDWQINVTKTKEYSNQIGLFAYLNEDRESAIYATGYWNGIAEGKKQYELYGAVWHDEHGYQFTATVGKKVLNEDRWIKLYRKVEK